MIWPFRNTVKPQLGRLPQTKVVVEIPDSLDPSAADRKYVAPLSQLLKDKNAGDITSVTQAAPNTVDEFTRILAIELTQVVVGLEIVGKFLAECGSPAGTIAKLYDASGNVVDHLILLP